MFGVNGGDTSEDNYSSGEDGFESSKQIKKKGGGGMGNKNELERLSKEVNLAAQKLKDSVDNNNNNALTNAFSAKRNSKKLSLSLANGTHGGRNMQLGGTFKREPNLN